MRAALAPLHLLVLDHSFAHHLIHRRLHKAGRDPFPVAIALSVVGHELRVAFHVGVQFLHPLQQFACVVILALIRRSLQVHLQTLQLIQGLKGIAVPQIPLDSPAVSPPRVAVHIAPRLRRSSPAFLWRSAAAPSAAWSRETSPAGVPPPGSNITAPGAHLRHHQKETPPADSSSALASVTIRRAGAWASHRRSAQTRNTCRIVPPLGPFAGGKPAGFSRRPLRNGLLCSGHGYNRRRSQPSGGHPAVAIGSSPAGNLR